MSLPRLFSAFQGFPTQHVHDLIDSWYESDIGQRTLAEEQALLDQILPSLFGYYLMGAGFGRPRLDTSSSPIKHRFFMSENFYADAPVASVQSKLSDLAVASDTVDVALLHHSLDFNANPHSLLREVTRTLIPGGKLVVIGFNPWSLWGLVRLFRARSVRAPWFGNFLSPFRVSDWLRLLDFQVDGCESAIYSLPSLNSSGQPRLSLLNTTGQRFLPRHGAVYMMVATKRVARVTPVKESRAKPVLLPLPISGIAKTASRSTEPSQSLGTPSLHIVQNTDEFSNPTVDK